MRFLCKLILLVLLSPSLLLAADPKADKIRIEDVGDYYYSTNVEGALQEAASLSTIGETDPIWNSEKANYFHKINDDSDDVIEGSTHLFDKTLILTEGDNIDIAGNYPNFTISATGSIDGSGIANYIPKFSDANSLSISSIYETAARNIGIGTTNPQFKVEILDNSNSGNAQIYVSNSNTNASATSAISIKNNVGYGGTIYATPSTSPDPDANDLGIVADYNLFLNAESTLFACLSGDPKLTIADSGIGIGTTNPSYTLDIFSNSTTVVPVHVRNDNIQDYPIMQVVNNSTANNAYAFYTAGNNINYANCQFGTGSSNVPYPFNNSVFVYADGTANRLVLGTGTSNPQTPDVLFQTAGLDRMYIDYNGNVGIGTTNPANKLDIVGSESGAFGISIQNNDTDSIASISRLSLVNGNGHGGVFGVSNENYALTYWKDSIVLYGDINIESLVYATQNPAGIIKFYTGGLTESNEAMRIDSAGDVGIGTTNPISKLSVNGDLSLQSGATVNEVSTDVTLGGNSDIAVVTEKAIKSYVDTTVAAGDYWDRDAGAGLLNPETAADVVVVGRNDIAPNGLFQVGIGDTNPLVVLKSNNGRVGIGITAPVQPFDMRGNGTVSAIFNNGSVGIGTTNPTNALAVVCTSNSLDCVSITGDNQSVGSVFKVSSNSSTNSIRQVVNIIQDNASTNSNTVLRLQQDSNGDFLNGYGGISPKITIKSNGYIGIGTTDPGYSISTQNAGAFMFKNASGGLMMYLADNIWVDYMDLSADGADFIFYNGSALYFDCTGGSAARQLFAVNRANNDKVGVGCSNPASRFVVSGGVGIGNSNPNNDYVWSKQAPDGGLIVQGNVGIGTTSPVVNLQVNGTIVTTNLCVGNTAPKNGSELLVGFGNTNPLYVDIETNRVGIGATSPVANLDVKGTAYLRGDANNNGLYVTTGGLVGIARTNPVSPLDVGGTVYLRGDNNNNGLYVAAGGKVGIGLTNPSEQLQISTGANPCVVRLNATDGKPRVYQSGVLGGDGFAMGENEYNYYVVNYDNPLSTFSKNLISGLKTGNVGIGATNPTYKFFVEASDNNESAMLVQNTSTGAAAASSINFNTNDGNAVMQFGATSSNYTTDLAFQDKSFVYSSNAKQALMLYTGGSNPIQFYPNGARGEAMRITPNGDVGIGTTAPTTQLQVTKTLTAATGDIGFPAGSFSTSTNLTLSSTTTAYPVIYTDNEATLGVSYSSNSHINIPTAGTYLITFSAVGKSTVANKQLEIWLAVDGNNVPRSNTISKFVGSGNERIITVTYIYTFTAGQYFELYYRADDTGCSMVATAAGTSPTRPACPSIIVTVNKISK